MNRQQSGFALGPLLLFILLVGAVGAFLLSSSRSKDADTDSLTVSLNVQRLLSSAETLREGFIRTAAKNNLNIRSVTFDDAPRTGLFNIATGGANPQQGWDLREVGFLQTWIMKDDVAMPSSGVAPAGTHAADRVLVFGPVPQAECVEYHKQFTSTETLSGGYSVDDLVFSSSLIPVIAQDPRTNPITFTTQPRMRFDGGCAKRGSAGWLFFSIAYN